MLLRRHECSFAFLDLCNLRRLQLQQGLPKKLTLETPRTPRMECVRLLSIQVEGFFFWGQLFYHLLCAVFSPDVLHFSTSFIVEILKHSHKLEVKQVICTAAKMRCISTRVQCIRMHPCISSSYISCRCLVQKLFAVQVGFGQSLTF